MSAKTDEKPAATEPAPDRWAASIKSTREAAIWVAAALGAVGAAIFGGIPALKGLPFVWGDPTDDAQTLAALGFALLGLGGIVTIILLVARATLPIYVTLSTLSAPTRAKITASPGEYLPPGMTTLAQLVKALADLDAVLPAFVAQARTADRAYRAASATDKATAEQTKDAAAEALETARTSLNTLREWASRLTQYDAYAQTQARVHNKSLWAVIAAATVGAVGFMFTTTGRGDPPPPAEAEAIGKVAVMVPTDDSAWRTILRTSDIDACERSDGTYLVLVRGFSSGTYTVQTLPIESGCDVLNLDVRADVVTVTSLAVAG